MATKTKPKGTAKKPATKKKPVKRTGTRKGASAKIEFIKDITPTPRILKVLGDIEFEPWQCVAEVGRQRVRRVPHIKRSGCNVERAVRGRSPLPAQTASRGEAAVIVRDNGRGMTLDQVTDSVRAGWTTNDPLSKLGLFGMGFNVATARLGRVTRS